MSKLGQLGAHLYQGKISFNFVGRRRLWYSISAVILIVAILGLTIRGLNFGIQFRGGVEFDTVVKHPAAHVTQIKSAVIDTGIEPANNPIVVASGDHGVLVQTEPLTLDQQEVVKKAILSAGADEVSPTSIGPTWGHAVAQKALTGLIVFVIVVILLMWAYFREWRMSIAGVAALAHDLVITVGVYALTGFEVTPATVTGVLTILGYSLYDTVVVFDKVRENTRGISSSTRYTYAESANLAVNQTLVRSVNTSIAALLPVAAILYVGVFQLGSGPLKDLALALFVGMAAGTYSSIFIATPFAVQLKMREPAMKAQAKRVANRRAQRGTEVVQEQPAGGGDPVPATVPPTTPTPSGQEPAAASDESARSTPPRPAREPTRSRPMSSAQAKRAQPKRQARSRRGKRR